MIWNEDIINRSKLKGHYNIQMILTLQTDKSKKNVRMLRIFNKLNNNSKIF